MIRDAGLLFGHSVSRAYDPREHIAEHPDTPERIEAVERALAAEAVVTRVGREARLADVSPLTKPL